MTPAVVKQRCAKTAKLGVNNTGTKGVSMNQNLSEMTKEQFVFECAVRALAGSMANPAAKASIASLVRDAEKLWHELDEWRRMQTQH